ncbi:hypothetical protein [Hymenobacter chitinivorans]|uniref:Uncharacterized protein n=1 Tax=Hymenobacter chitinivorans DSM 11115 TaxID=1121954 RepID=A0A2M9B5N1_9BACT|nr:hypothetical protein [Hymenobacter chitinivorans]PJJ53245.1 hypothetical protein CLV45_3905 [Hymenobacter chitinivorans DSM 11115]
MFSDGPTTSQLNKFIDFHISINSYIKLSVASVNFLSSSNDDPNKLSKLISELITSAGERWTQTTYNNPFKELEKLKFQITESAIARVYSSFEVFLDEINGSFSEYKKNNTDNSNDSLNSVQYMFSQFDWDYSEIEYLTPAYNFYTHARHCIVHRMGEANSTLEEISSSKEFTKAIESWPTVIPGRKISPPPIVDSNGKLTLKPHHAISYSDICLRIAKLININTIQMIGLKYFINKTYKNYLLDSDSLIGPTCENVHEYIRLHIRNDYNFDSLSISDIKSTLDEIGLRRKYSARYSLLKSKVKSNKKN